MSKRPDPIEIDGERIFVDEEMDVCPLARTGRHMNLSPFEAEQLRDWLNEYLEWYYNDPTKRRSHTLA